MSVIADVEKLVFSLPEKDRTELVGKILRSLPLYADDGGLAEARRRDLESNDDPKSMLTMDQLDDLIAKEFPFVRQ